MTKVTAGLLKALRPELTSDRAQITAEKLSSSCERFQISSPLEVAHFVAQLAHESGLVPREENLNYSASRLRAVWPNRFTLLSSLQYRYQPQKLANLVYANRMGNGNVESGDGWRYRGRGFIQLTGKDNYRFIGELIRYDLVRDPSLLLQIGISCLAAGAFWQSHNLSQYALRDDLLSITAVINGTRDKTRNGFYDREKYLIKAKTFLGLTK